MVGLFVPPNLARFNGRVKAGYLEGQDDKKIRGEKIEGV